MRCAWSQYERMQEAYPNALVCARQSSELRAPERATLKNLERLQGAVAIRFQYVREDRDIWHVHKVENALIKGDCDDLAWTVLEQLLAEGWPRELLWSAIVNTDSVDGFTPHMVAVADLVDGKRYVAADSKRMLVHPIEKSRHTFYMAMNMARLGQVELRNLKDS